MSLKIKNSKTIAVLVAVLFLFSLFPGYGFAAESLDPANPVIETPADQDSGQGNSDGSKENDPQVNPGENLVGTPGDESQPPLDENQVQTPVTVVPAKASLTINHVLVLEDGSEELLETATLQDLNVGDTVASSDYQLSGEEFSFVRSTPEELVLGEQDNELTLWYAPAVPAKASLTINHVLVLEDGSEELLETATLQDLNVGDTVAGSDYQLSGEEFSFVRSTPEELLLGEQDNELTLWYAPAVPVEKVSLTINHVLDRGDGSEKLTYTETIEGLDAGTTVQGSDYQVQEEGIVFIGSQPEQLVLGAQDNVINLLYNPGPINLREENPDHLSGPQEISAPVIQYPNNPSALMSTKAMRSMGLLSETPDSEPGAGTIVLSKQAAEISGVFNQWQVTLTITGKDKVESSSADIVLVIDRSGSMAGSRLNDAKAAARSFVDTVLTPGNTSRRIAIVSFANDVTIDSGDVDNAFKGTAEKQTLLSAIDGLSADDGTFTQAGLKQAQALLGPSSEGTDKVIVLISDGVATYSYKIKNPSNYLKYWYTKYVFDRFRTSESVPESAFIYNKTVGDGENDHEEFDWYRYYSHGNSAISQSKFAKAAGQTIYTVALDAGDEGNRVLNGIASPDKSYTGSSSDLNSIFQQIATDITKYAATNVTVTDPMADEFSIPGITDSNYASRITVNQGTVSWNDSTETITWTIPFIAEDNPATMTYIVEIDEGVSAGQYLTNKTTPIRYTDVNGNPANTEFIVPQVEIEASDLTYTVKYFVDNVEQTAWQESSTVPASNPVVNSVPSKTPTGYMLDTANSTSLPFTVSATNNAINVYYIKDPTQWHTVTFAAGANGSLETGDQTVFEDILDGTAWASAVTVPTPVANPGYSFSGWEPSLPEPNAAITANATYTANFAPIDYSLTINYQYEDGSPAAPAHTDKLNIGDSYNVDSPAIAGYTADQANVNGTMPADDVTVTVTYTARTDTAYQVKHYLEDLNADTYTLEETDDMTGTTGEQTEAEANTYTGFTAKSFDQTEIAANGNTVVEIYYSRDSYTITYDVTGDYFAEDDYASETYEYGATVTAVANPSETGYTFAGWTGVPETMPAENVTATGYYTARTDTAYQVKHYLEDLNADTYTLEETDDMTGTTGEQTEAEANTYTGFTAKSFDQTEIAANGNTVVEIYYSRDSYTITYDITGDYFAEDDYASETYEYGATVTAVANPSETGYTFAGWTGVPETMPAENVTATGYYQKDPSLWFNVLYDVNGGEGSNFSDPDDYLEGQWVQVAGAYLSRENYVFAGWNTAADGSGDYYVPYSEFEMPAEDVTLYAQWIQAVDDAYTTKKNTLLSIAAPGVLSNDARINVEGFWVENLTNPDHGVLVFNPDGSFTYTPEDGFTGEDSFVYRLCFEMDWEMDQPRVFAVEGDYNGEYNGEEEYDPEDPAVAVVTITVTETNAAPVAVDDAYRTRENRTLTVAAPGILSNDTDANTDALTAVKVSDPAHGTLTLNEDGSFSYVPDRNYDGTDSFTYQAKDGIAESNIATVTITVTRRSSGGGGGGDDPTPPEQEIVVEPEATLVPLNREDHFAYMAGYPDNTLRPEGRVTREEVAAVFYRLLDDTYRESVKTDANNFSDVQAGRWSNTQISTLAAVNIITGYPEGTFRPSNSITRAELATIASKFDELSPFEANNFSDILGHWANQYINSAAQKGWVTGYQDGTFKPEQAITRAEFMTLVNNVLGRKVKKENILPEAKQFPDLSPEAWYYEAAQEAINSHNYERENPTDYEVWTEIYESNIDL